MRNLITDVAGIRVGNAHDARLISGVTVAIFEPDARLALTVRGGAPGFRSGAGFEPGMAVEAANAVVLSGGSAFGLDATTGVEAWLREQGRGFAVGPVHVPIVAQAISFDLLNGGDKAWGRYPPYRELGFQACEAASELFELGTAGGGFGSTTVNLKGGLGSASARTSAGHTVGALALVNAIGSAVVGDGPYFWAAPFEQGNEFGGLGAKPRLEPGDLDTAHKGREARRAEPATTLALVATDADLTHTQVKRLAITADDGLARGLRLAHAHMDGDTVFAASTGRRALGDVTGEQIELGAVAADCLTRAIARAVYLATTPPLPYAGPIAYRDRFKV